MKQTVTEFAVATLGIFLRVPDIAQTSLDIAQSGSRNALRFSENRASIANIQRRSSRLPPATHDMTLHDVKQSMSALHFI